VENPWVKAYQGTSTSAASSVIEKSRVVVHSRGADSSRGVVGSETVLLIMQCLYGFWSACNVARLLPFCGPNASRFVRIRQAPEATRKDSRDHGCRPRYWAGAGGETGA